MSAKKEIDWISIKDSQPNDKELVLVYGQDYESESNDFSVGLVYWNHNLLGNISSCNIIGVHQIKDFSYHARYYHNVTLWAKITNPDI